MPPTNLAIPFISAVFASLPDGVACINIEILDHQPTLLFDAVFKVVSDGLDPTFLRLTWANVARELSLVEVDFGGDAIDRGAGGIAYLIVHSFADVDAALQVLPTLLADVLETTTREFKVGDRVKIVRKVESLDWLAEYMDVTVGCIGTVEKVADRDGDVRVRVGRAENSWYYRKAALEHVAPVKSDDRDPTLLRLTWGINRDGMGDLSLLEVDHGGEAIDRGAGGLADDIVHSFVDVDAALQVLPAALLDVLCDD